MQEEEGEEDNMVRISNDGVWDFRVRRHRRQQVKEILGRDRMIQHHRQCPRLTTGRRVQFQMNRLHHLEREVDGDK